MKLKYIYCSEHENGGYIVGTNIPEEEIKEFSCLKCNGTMDSALEFDDTKLIRYPLIPSDAIIEYMAERLESANRHEIVNLPEELRDARNNTVTKPDFVCYMYEIFRKLF